MPEGYIIVAHIEEWREGELNALFDNFDIKGQEIIPSRMVTILKCESDLFDGDPDDHYEAVMRNKAGVVSVDSVQKLSESEVNYWREGHIA